MCGLIGPYTFKVKDGTKIDFMCVTMIDPATSWLEIVELLVSKHCLLDPLLIFLTRDDTKPWPKKVHAILALTSPQKLKQLCRFLGMVQYYRDLWARCSEMLSPLTNLVGEWMHTKARKTYKTWNCGIGAVCMRLDWTPWRQQLIKMLSWHILTTHWNLKYTLTILSFHLEQSSLKKTGPWHSSADNWTKHCNNTLWLNKNYCHSGNVKEFKGLLCITVYMDNKNLMQNVESSLWSNLQLEITLGRIWPHHYVHKNINDQ